MMKRFDHQVFALFLEFVIILIVIAARKNIAVHQSTSLAET